MVISQWWLSDKFAPLRKQIDKCQRNSSLLKADFFVFLVFWSGGELRPPPPQWWSVTLSLTTTLWQQQFSVSDFSENIIIIIIVNTCMNVFGVVVVVCGRSGERLPRERDRAGAWELHGSRAEESGAVLPRHPPCTPTPRVHTFIALWVSGRAAGECDATVGSRSHGGLRGRCPWRIYKTI